MSSSSFSILPPPGKGRKVDARRFLDISAQETPSDEESLLDVGDEGDFTGMFVAPILVKWLTLCSSGNFIAAPDDEEEGEGGSFPPPSNPNFDMDIDEDLDELVRSINEHAVHYNRSVRQTAEQEDWREDVGNAVLEAVNKTTYIGDPANGLWLV